MTKILIDAPLDYARVAHQIQRRLFVLQEPGQNADKDCLAPCFAIGADGPRIEPGLTDPEFVMLPLHYPVVCKKVFRFLTA
jgi:hypothetical protein